MAAALTLEPRLSTKDFRGAAKPVVRRLATFDDLMALALEDAVFLDPWFVPACMREVFWALVTAINLAGAAAILPRADCDGNGAVPYEDVGGGALIRGVTCAINMLGGYYTMAGKGDVWALLVTRGFHRVLTVVGHSDEGGVTREILRYGRVGKPHGAFPSNMHMFPGIPVASSGRMETITNIVDSVLLGTAALVAHCDPMVLHDGELYPTILSVEKDTNEAGYKLTSVDRGNIIPGRLLAVYPAFAAIYARGLAKLFGCTASPDHPDSDHPDSASMLESAAQCFACAPSGHVAYAAVAPYFWIEPTSLLPADFLGTAAERGGSGALASPWIPRILPMFRKAEEAGPCSFVQSNSIVKYKSARTCGYALYTSGHWWGGTAMAQFKVFDPEHMALARITPDEMERLKVEQGYVGLNELLWTRGQSKIPHPAEALCLDSDVCITLLVSSVRTTQSTVVLRKRVPPSPSSRG